MTTLAEWEEKDPSSSRAASSTRAKNDRKKRTSLALSHLIGSYTLHRGFRKWKQWPFSFAYHSRLFRALKCYSAVLNDVAIDAWRHASGLPADKYPAFWNAFKQEYDSKVDPELRKRGLIWKDSDRNFLTAFSIGISKVGSLSTDPVPDEWLQVPDSIRLARTQVSRCKNAVHDQVFEKENWISRHFDLHHFERCKFIDCDLSNASFESSVFTTCSFLNVTMVNTRLTSAAFDGCSLTDVDFAGAMLENVRFWYRNRFTSIQVDAFTRVSIPLIEECELSYELASRNYGLWRSWYSDAGLRWKRSECAYRERYCLAQSYPYEGKRLWLALHWLLSGYNERPLSFLLWVVMFNFVFAFAYLKVGVVKSNREVLTFLDALYFSVVTFTTLGYGDIAPSNHLGQVLVVLEVGLGVVAIAYLTALLIRRLL